MTVPPAELCVPPCPTDAALLHPQHSPSIQQVLNTCALSE